MTRALPASLIAALAFALVPVAAVAQDASCQQYCDPLAGTPKPTRHPPGSSTSGATSRSAQASTATPGQTTQGAATTTGTTAAAASQPGLPRTGFPVGLLLFAATLLVSGGWALRRVTGTTGP